VGRSSSRREFMTFLLASELFRAGYKLMVYGSPTTTHLCRVNWDLNGQPPTDLVRATVALGKDQSKERKLGQGRLNHHSETTIPIQRISSTMTRMAESKLAVFDHRTNLESHLTYNIAAVGRRTMTTRLLHI
jgi:hypothetical protein